MLLALLSLLSVLLLPSPFWFVFVLVSLLVAMVAALPSFSVSSFAL